MSALQFSQSSLQDYVDCARRFELKYLMQLKYPAPEAEPIIEQEWQVELGQQFHHLIQQHLVGVPIERLTASIVEEKIKLWWQRYLADGLTGLPVTRLPEKALFAPIAGHQIIAKYDLLAIAPGDRLVILDWKTSEQKTKREHLAKRLQTIVYRYVLVEAGTHLNGGVRVEPEQVEMLYWFAEHPQQCERFSYDATEHQQAGDYLTRLVQEVQTRTEFELTPDVWKCKYCTYRSLCRRGVVAGDVGASEFEGEDQIMDDGFHFDFDQIAEIEF